MVKSNDDRCERQRCMEAGDLAPLVAEFTRHLAKTGHTSLTVSGYDAAARHFAQWLSLTKSVVADIDDAVVDRFAPHCCRCPGIRRVKNVSKKYVRRVRRFVAFLSKHGAIQRKTAIASPAFDRRVIEFQDWLRHHRGITERTIDRHGRMVMRLLPSLGGRPRSWNAQLIRDVIPAETKQVSLAHAKTMATALRGYLRFLAVQGLCRPGLDGAVPIIPQWRLSTLPRYIGMTEVERLIVTCDVTTRLAFATELSWCCWHVWVCEQRTLLRFNSRPLIGGTPRSPFTARAVERRGFPCCHRSCNSPQLWALKFP